MSLLPLLPHPLGVAEIEITYSGVGGHLVSEDECLHFISVKELQRHGFIRWDHPAVQYKAKKGYVTFPFILDIRLVDVPAVVTQDEGHKGFLHLPSAVFALIFLARRIQPFLSLVHREVEFCVLIN